MTAAKSTDRYVHEPPWECIIPNDQWETYLKAIRATRATGAEFMLGGAFGLVARRKSM